jgi:medium-chain acyl-[acyl-carrier-protein] hydrolase
LHLLNYLDPTEPPLIFFGHSYGGIIAYELSLLLLRNDYLLPHLIISSTNNPSLLNARSAGTVVSKKHHLLSDEELLQEVLRHGGLPAGVHLDILRHMLPVIRGDYKGLETYSFSLPVSSDEQHLPSSLATYPGYLTVLGSEQDPGDVTQASLYGWRDYSQASDERFSIHLFPSQSHFSFLEPCNSTDFFEKIREICLNPLQQPYPPLPLLT